MGLRSLGTFNAACLMAVCDYCGLVFMLKSFCNCNLVFFDWQLWVRYPAAAAAAATAPDSSTRNSLDENDWYERCKGAVHVFASYCCRAFIPSDL